MRSKPYKTVRIEKELAERILTVIAVLRPTPSLNATVEAMAEDVTAMIEDPKARVLPQLVRLIDEAKRGTMHPLSPEPLKAKSKAAQVASARTAHLKAAKAAKQKRHDAS